LDVGMRIVVGIPTTGRKAILSETLLEIAKQIRLPECVIICPLQTDDVDHEFLATLPYSTKIVSGPPGSAAQRNTILRTANSEDVIVFFDDDYFPSPNFLANAEAILQRDEDIVVVTGTLIEDGINGPGLTPERARASLAAIANPIGAGRIKPDYGAYGCNMVVRLAPVRKHELVFDEALPLYSWQEDIDFSRQMAVWGRIVRAESLTGVHLGVKRGRTSGFRFGYSQVANPIYLMRKGTVSLSFGGQTLVKNIAANCGRAFRPESYVDRRGRLRGNMLAFLDLLRGRLHPQRILDLDAR
jgi:GT2 family glycosyltransferase